MAGITNDLAQDLLDHFLDHSAYSPLSSWHLGLFSSDPTDAGGGTELAGSGYARVSTSSGDWSAPSSTGQSTNASAFLFPVASGAWAAASSWGIFSAPTGGTLLAWDTFGPHTVGSGKQFEFPAAPDANSITIDFNSNAGHWSDYLAQKLLETFLNKGTWTPPATYYHGLYSVAPTDAGGGTELSGNGYARKSSVTADWDVATATGTSKNANEIRFAAASGGNWLGALAHGWFDAATSGNLLLWNTMVLEQVSIGEILLWKANQHTLSFNAN